MNVRVHIQVEWWLTGICLSSSPKVRKQLRKRACATEWLNSPARSVVLASSAKMAPPVKMALLPVKFANVTSDMSTCEGVYSVQSGDVRYVRYGVANEYPAIQLGRQIKHY